MIGPYYVNTDARRRAAWGPPCDVTFASVVIDGRTFKVERRVKDAFDVWEQMRAKYLYHLEGPDTGFYNCRRMRHDPKLPYSPHAWATALDVNWLENPAGSRLVSNIPKLMVIELQQIKTASGAYVFMWGGDWDRNPRTGHTYYDAMHWAVIAHPLDLATGIVVSGFITSPPTIPIGDDDVALKNPSRGNAVKLIQQCLNIWKPSLSLLDDGIFGDGTEAAIRQYQESAQIPVNGMIDGLTASLLTTIKLRKTTSEGGVLP